ncbi:DNA repair protein complementing XP-C cells isoform X2 [Thalassophryne amazonica]|uniref:DNA repair protein complementing XP-C cells isoform X2 n=1 Tax=Thalassophryne amazonica TaxID=390379 RepID=UPI0014708709|nr:DNA repair protein complementing XP-C cells isoform X2 [Thalassophryne amazonica]
MKRSRSGIKDKEEEEELQRKVKYKPHSSTKRASQTTIQTTTCVEKMNPKKQEEEESEEDDDWEEVEELAEPLDPSKPPEPVLPSQPVEIEIEGPQVRKRKKMMVAFEAHLKRMMNRYKKNLLVDTHKVHLMCLIASEMFRNRMCSEPDLLAITLSLLPAHFGMVAKQRIDQNYLSGLLKWFRATFTLNPSLPPDDGTDPRALLERRLASLSFRNHQEMTHLFLLVLRSLQLFCRLVLSLQPVPLKLSSKESKKFKTSAGSTTKNDTDEGLCETSPHESKVSPGTKRPPRGRKTKGNRGGKKAKRQNIKEDDEEEEKVIPTGRQRPKNAKRRSVASKVSYKEESNSEGEDDERLSDEEDFQVTNEENSDDSDGETKSTKTTTRKARVCKNQSTQAPKRRSDGENKQGMDEDEEMEDFEKENSRIKRRSGKKREGPGDDEWLEVYVEKMSSWVCVDVEHGVGLPHLCFQNATAPVTYVVAVDGNGFIKDLGRKYDPAWMTCSRKRRVNEDWWEETLQPFLGPKDERDKKEDEEVQNKLLNKALPISITEYKNHPMYALKRHLLKYEAIYPTSAAVLGYCRGEPVYSRDCVHTLHSRDTWLKQARTVRLGEEPYKMVKGFSNRSRKARMMSELKDENDLPLFGEWQTEQYQPPVTVNGKVPRNDYGNVYLYQPCMLPVGCVHLRLPNLHRVAKKLNIDAVPAVTGFDIHNGFSHAVTDGYVVCEEHEEVLRAAWIEEQQIQKEKEKEKREKRVIANWTVLVKGLLIRERLKKRYGKKTQGSRSQISSKDSEMGPNGLSSDEEVDEGGSPEDKSASDTLALSWPQNKQVKEDSGTTSGLKKTRREKKGQEKHLFPFEKT